MAMVQPTPSATKACLVRTHSRVHKPPPTLSVSGRKSIKSRPAISELHNDCSSWRTNSPFRIFIATEKLFRFTFGHATIFERPALSKILKITVVFQSAYHRNAHLEEALELQ